MLWSPPDFAAYIQQRCPDVLFSAKNCERAMIIEVLQITDVLCTFQTRPPPKLKNGNFLT